MAMQCSSSAIFAFVLVYSFACTQAIGNVSLRCCVLVEPPSVFEDPSKKYGFDGLAIDYLKGLQEKTGFSCKSVSLFRRGHQVGFTDFIYYMENCTTLDGKIRQNDPDCVCDIGAAGFGINTERIGRVDYIQEFAGSDQRVVTHVDNMSTMKGGAFFITSFSVSLWGSILGLAAVFTFLKLLDRRFSPPDENYEPLPRSENWFRRWRHFFLRSRIPFRLRKAVESTMYRMIGQATNNIPGDYSSTRQRILNFAIVLCGLFLILAYEATMTASLVQESNETEFRGVEDFKNCRIASSEVCIPGGGALQTYWDAAIASTPCHKREDQSGPKIIDSYDELIEKTVRKECKYSVALGSTLLHAVVGKHCGKLALTGEPFVDHSLAFVLPKGSELTLKMSNATLQLKAEGTLKSFQEYLGHQEQCSLKSRPTLTFSKLRIFFFVAFSVCFLVFLEMVIDPQTEISESTTGVVEGSTECVYVPKFRRDLESPVEISAPPFGNFFHTPSHENT